MDRYGSFKSAFLDEYGSFKTGQNYSENCRSVNDGYLRGYDSLDLRMVYNLKAPSNVVKGKLKIFFYYYYISFSNFIKIIITIC